MATQVTLKAEVRKQKGKSITRKLRAEGLLPAVVYGAETDPIPLTLNAHDTEHLFHSISVDNTIVNLELEGEKIPVPTLVREIQTDPVRSDLIHVDFYRIQTGVAVELDVPVHLEGTPKGVRDDGGVLEQPVYNLPIRCVPADIPEEIVVDVSELEIGDSIHVGELALPDGVEALLELDRTVCSVQVPTQLAADTDEPDEEELEEPELVGEVEEGEEAPEDAEAEED